MVFKRKSLAQYESESTTNGECLEHKSVSPRLIYKLRHGDIPDSLFVCHTCDNPSCINDSHHFLGTSQDNVKDSVAKGRHSSLRKGGVRFSGTHTDEVKQVIGARTKQMWAEPGRKEAQSLRSKEYWANKRKENSQCL
jgi:hypothetical protein